MNEVSWRFGEVSAIQAESATRDLQFLHGLRASNKQGSRFLKGKVTKIHCFVTNQMPFRFQEELMVRFESQKRDLQF